MNTRLLASAQEAADIIKNGGLVAVPTETVYGLAANALDAGAVRRIYDVKGRPEIKPLSIMVSGSEAFEKFCADVPRVAYSLAEDFFPGPLTIVLKSGGKLPEIVLAGGNTVGLRCPKHELTLETLRLCELPLAAPSANPSGKPGPTTAAQVLEYFDGKIDAVLDGGECQYGSASTIIDLSVTPFSLLRVGALNTDKITRSLRRRLKIVGITGGTGTGKTTALNILQEMGALVIDCDDVYHKLLETDAAMLAEIHAAFPPVFENETLDRKKLGIAVFSDPAALLRLNEITHGFVGKRVDEALDSHAMHGGIAAAIDAIALIESGIAEKCGNVVGITAPFDDRVRRITQREGISREYAKLRIAAQKPNEYYIANCTYTIDNSTTTQEFENRCRELFGKLLEVSPI